MRLKQVKKINLAQWYWLFQAYFRLWYVRARLRFGSVQWLRRQLSLADSNISSSVQEGDSLHQPLRKAVDNESESTSESTSTGSTDPNSQAIAERVHESVRLAARLHFLPMHCLPRSIVLTNMLVHLGMPAKMFIGIRKGSEVKSIESHAWVELEGHVLVEPETIEQDFIRIKRS